jgi:hypothetical protein
MPKTETKNDTIKAAKEYVKQQIATMKAHGQAPRLSSAAINEMVSMVAKAAK